MSDLLVVGKDDGKSKFISEFIKEHEQRANYDIGLMAIYKQINNVLDLPYWVVNIIVKHHFDAFGLIEQGLALNINEVWKQQN